MEHDMRFQKLLQDMDKIIAENENNIYSINISRYTSDKVSIGLFTTITDKEASNDRWTPRKASFDRSVDFTFSKYGIEIWGADSTAFLYILLKKYPFWVYRAWISDTSSTINIKKTSTRNLYDAYYDVHQDIHHGEATLTLWN